MRIRSARAEQQDVPAFERQSIAQSFSRPTTNPYDHVRILHGVCGDEAAGARPPPERHEAYDALNA